MGRKLTQEQKEHFREKRNKTMMEKYGCLSFTDVDKVHKTKLERYGDPNYNNMDKNRETCLKKYGVEHHNKNKDIAQKISNTKKSSLTQDKYENTLLQKYGQSNVNLVDSIKQKMVHTLLQHYGVDSPLKSKEIKEKQLSTLKENGSYGKSRQEEELYSQLCNQYGVDDVVRQYSDERYPFNCDFYVKSEDLFIELNIHPTHNTHPFNPKDENDIILLEELRRQNTPWSNAIIDVWTERDVIKLECAKRNNLNYKVIYKLN